MIDINSYITVVIVTQLHVFVQIHKTTPKGVSLESYLSGQSMWELVSRQTSAHFSYLLLVVPIAPGLLTSTQEDLNSHRSQ